MRCFKPAGRFNFAAATLLAGVITVGMIACSEDSPTEPSKQAVVGAPAHVEVLAAPANDDPSAAVPITALPFTHSVSTVEATEIDDPPTDCSGVGSTVWYQFIPSADITIIANTSGSDYDTGIAVYTGTPGQLTEIACNDDFNGLQSRVVLDVLAGETYLFMVGSFGGGDGGSLVFNVDVAQPPLEAGLTIAPRGSVNSTTGVAVVRGTVTCSRPASVFISGHARQRAGRVFLDGDFFSFVECDGETPWEATTQSQNGIFKGGQIEVSLFAEFVDPTTVDPVFLDRSATVRLNGSGR